MVGDRVVRLSGYFWYSFLCPGLVGLRQHRRYTWPIIALYHLFGLAQSCVNTGVAMYEAVAATGTLAVEHTSVAEILAAVAR